MKRSQVLALMALTLLATTTITSQALASSRSGRGGITTLEAYTNSQATASQSDRLNGSSSDDGASVSEGMMRRSRSGFGDIETSKAIVGSLTHKYNRNGETLVSLTRESDERRQNVKFSIEGIVDADKHEFLKALKAEIQSNVAVRANITFNAISDDSAPRTRFATSFYISTGMRHMMTEAESTSIFEAADKSMKELLENVTVTTEEAAKPVPTGRRRF